jgi:hypothetical protein
MIAVVSSLFAAVSYKQPSAVCESRLDHDAHCHFFFFVLTNSDPELALKAHEAETAMYQESASRPARQSRVVIDIRDSANYDELQNSYPWSFEAIGH